MEREIASAMPLREEDWTTHRLLTAETSDGLGQNHLDQLMSRLTRIKIVAICCTRGIASANRYTSTTDSSVYRSVEPLGSTVELVARLLMLP